MTDVCDGCAMCEPEKDIHCPRCCSVAHPDFREEKCVIADDPPCRDCEAEYQAELAHDEGRCGGSLKGTCRICEKAFDRAQERWGLDHLYGPGTAAEGRI